MARIYIRRGDGNTAIPMGSHSPAIDVDETKTDAILELIDEEEAKSVNELVEDTEFSSREVQRILEELMDRGLITSTPDWRYRESRRSEA